MEGTGERPILTENLRTGGGELLARALVVPLGTWWCHPTWTNKSTHSKYSRLETRDVVGHRVPLRSVRFHTERHGFATLHKRELCARFPLAPRRLRRRTSLDRHIRGRHVERIEHELHHVLPVGLGVL